VRAVEWIHGLAQVRDGWWDPMNVVMNVWVPAP
jgi:hypothetical protein